jgi:hypothetical protein
LRSPLELPVQVEFRDRREAALTPKFEPDELEKIVA